MTPLDSASETCGGGERGSPACSPASARLPACRVCLRVRHPADVLANRPDVRQAGLQLKSADWSVSAARADRLPAIRLSASASYASDDAGSLALLHDVVAPPRTRPAADDSIELILMLHTHFVGGKLRIEREILSKAAAWFARETDSIPSKSSRS